MISQGIHMSSSGGRTIELRQLLQRVSTKFRFISYYDPADLRCSGQRICIMVLPSSRRPDRSHLPKTSSNSKVASDTKEEAVKERCRASRRQDDRQCAREGNPSAETVN
jgi:hypothetical protein